METQHLACPVCEETRTFTSQMVSDKLIFDICSAVFTDLGKATAQSQEKASDACDRERDMERAIRDAIDNHNCREHG